jgi:hypothetical protein
MDENPVQMIGRVTLAMLGVGVGIALVAFLTGQWISAAVVPGLNDIETQIVTSYTPLAFLSITALSAPIVAGIIGIVEGPNSPTTRDAAVVGVACLVGASLMILIAGAGIAFAEPQPLDTVDTGDDTDDEMVNDTDNATDDTTNDTDDNETDSGDNETDDNETDSGDNETDDNETDSGDNETDGGDGGGGGGGEPGILDIIGLAGLCGIAASITGFVTAKSIP